MTKEHSGDRDAQNSIYADRVIEVDFSSKGRPPGRSNLEPADLALVSKVFVAVAERYSTDHFVRTFGDTTANKTLMDGLSKMDYQEAGLTLGFDVNLCEVSMHLQARFRKDDLMEVRCKISEFDELSRDDHEAALRRIQSIAVFICGNPVICDFWDDPASLWLDNVWAMRGVRLCIHSRRYLDYGELGLEFRTYPDSWPVYNGQFLGLETVGVTPTVD